MSSLFFTCKSRVLRLPHGCLREDAQALLQHARTISSSEMVHFYSHGGSYLTEAALEWTEYNQFGVGEVYFWRGSGMSRELYEALVEDQLEDCCMIRAARLPFVHEYIQPPCLTFASGSHLYGIVSEQSDWDGVVLVNHPQQLKTIQSHSSASTLLACFSRKLKEVSGMHGSFSQLLLGLR